MKKIIPLLLILCYSNVNAQTNAKDSLKQLLQKEIDDTTRVMALTELSFVYLESNPDTSMLLALDALSLARKIDFKKGEGESLNRVGSVYNVLGNYPKAMDLFLQAQKLNEKNNNLI